MQNLLKRECSAVQLPVAVAVLSFHRDHASTLPIGQHRKLYAKQLAFCWRRRANECAQLESIGVPAATSCYPRKFWGWIDNLVIPPVRNTPSVTSGGGPLAYVQKWDLRPTAICGAIVFGRAGDRVRAELKKGADLSLQFRRSLIHTHILPTALSSRMDHYWLLGQDRYMSVIEVCRSMGLPDSSTLSRALTRVPTPTNAVAMAGNGVHTAVARVLLKVLSGRGLLPATVRYASVCSGVDFFAPAVQEIRPGSFHYMFAAECEAGARQVLHEAWALPYASIHDDATDMDTDALPDVDLLVATPECKKLSRRRHGGGAELSAEGAAEASACLDVLRARKAKVVVVENVATADSIANITTVLRRAGGYVWQGQVLDPMREGGVPARRERHYWLGVREGA